MEQDGRVRRRPSYAANPEVGRRGQEAHARLLAALHDLVGEQGVAGARASDVARRVGYSRAAFYQYFPGVEDALALLVDAAFDDLVAAVGAVGPVDGGARGRDRLQQWFAALDEPLRRHGPFLAAVQDAARRDPDLGALTGARFARLEDALRTRLRRPRAAGDDLAVACFLAARLPLMLHRTSALLTAEDGGAGQDAVAAALADVFHRSLFGVRAGVNSAPRPASARRPARPDPATADPATADPATADPATADRPATRDALVAAAFEEFSARGYVAVTITDITRRAGVSHGAAYRHFATKQDLFRAVGLAYSARYVEHFARLADLDLGAAGAGERFRAWFDTFCSISAPISVLMLEWATALATTPALTADTARALAAVHEPLVAVLSGRGVARPGPEASILMAVLNTVAIQPDRQVVAGATARLVLRAVLLADD